MSEALRILSVGAGTLLAIVVFAMIVFWFIEDVTQKKHAVLRNYMLYPYPKASAESRLVRVAAAVAPAHTASRSAATAD